MFLEGKATQIAIGQIRGYLKPSKAERAAAFELFVELSVRVTTPSIDDERGTLRDTFDNLAAIGDVTREILRKHGCDAAKGREDGGVGCRRSSAPGWAKSCGGVHAPMGTPRTCGPVLVWER